MTVVIDHLLRACRILERSAPLPSMRRVYFERGIMRAFNGLVQYEATSGIDCTEEPFAVSEEKLELALKRCGEKAQVSTDAKFLKLKTGPLSVRVRKFPTDDAPALPPISLPEHHSAYGEDARALLAVMRQAEPFVSTDASRPWSVSLLVKDGYAWATNNLALVRIPLPASLASLEFRVPGGALDFLCSLPSLDSFTLMPATEHLVFQYEDSFAQIAQSTHPWPEVTRFFAAMPSALPEVPPALREAIENAERFAERFIAVDSTRVETKSEAIETEFEVALERSEGLYNAKLLALLVKASTHLELSAFPKPAFFVGPNGLQGTAVGMRQ